MSTTTPERSGRSGIAILALLALVFFTLLGLIFLFATKEKPEPARPSAANLYVIPIRLKLRTQPVANGPVVTSVERGTKLVQLEDRGAWVRVQAPDGVDGWAERTYLEKEGEHQRRFARMNAIRNLPSFDGVVSERAPLYAGPGVFYPLVGELQPDIKVKVYTRDHDFFAIDNGGELAYAEVDAIDLSASRGSAALEVASEDAAPTEPATAPAAPEPVEPEASPSPVAAEPATGVYPAVPPGGTPPVIVDRVKPRYPMIARRAGTEGVVIIRAIIRRDGSIDDVQVIQDLPNGLGDAARSAVEDWRFRPATYRGEPIDVYYTVTINFRLAQ